MNERGVIAIPARLREAFGLKAGDELIVEPVVEGILLRPSMSVPVETYSEQRIAEFVTEFLRHLGGHVSMTTLKRSPPRRPFRKPSFLCASLAIASRRGCR